MERGLVPALPAALLLPLLAGDAIVVVVHQGAARTIIVASDWEDGSGTMASAAKHLQLGGHNDGVATTHGHCRDKSY
jgi:hypothetical protein